MTVKIDTGKAIKIPMVKSCPHVKPSKGIVRLSSELISMLAAAVDDKDEWAIILKGTRSDDGYDATVTSFWLPEQDRSGGHVSVKEYDGFEIIDGVVKQDDNIGVIHSHNSMGAFFSSLDRDKLNPRYPISIVVAQPKNTLKYLGFAYEAVGKIKLPCGTTAEVPFSIQPLEGPTLFEITRFAVPEGNEVKDLGDCPHHENEPKDQYHVQLKAKCGLVEPEQLRANAFGKEDTTLLKMVEALPRAKETIVTFTPGVGFKNGNGNYLGTGRNALTRQELQNHPNTHWCKDHLEWDFCEFNHQQLAKRDAEVTNLHNKANGNGKGRKGSKGKKGAKPTNDRGWLGKYEARFAGGEEETTLRLEAGICLNFGCLNATQPKSFYCSTDCYDVVRREDRLEQQEEAQAEATECSKCTQTTWCSTECEDKDHQAWLNATEQEEEIRPPCTDCTATTWCSEKCKNLAADDLTYWCDPCADYDYFEGGICGFCAAPYCLTCEQGHKGNCTIDAEQETGNETTLPDGSVIVRV